MPAVGSADPSAIRAHSRTIRRSVGELILDERDAHLALALTSLQMQKTVERFHETMAALFKKRERAQSDLLAIRAELEKHATLAELCGLPPELLQYTEVTAPIGKEKAFAAARQLARVTGSCCDEENAAADDCGGGGLGASSSYPITLMMFGTRAADADQYPATDLALFQSCLSTQRIATSVTADGGASGGVRVSYRDVQAADQQGRLTETHFKEEPPAFVPLRRHAHHAQRGTSASKNNSKQTADGASVEGASVLVRRPVTADIAVCKSSLPEAGRCLVSKRLYSTGALLFVESPCLTVLHDASKALLPPLTAGAFLQRVLQKQREVLEVRRWDMRLAVAVASLIAAAEEHGPVVSSAVAGLCCPLEAMDTDALNDLCDYSKFLRGAMPPSLQEQYSEDSLTGFLVAFQANAFSHGGPQLAATDAVGLTTGSEEKSSIFVTAALLQHSCDPNCTVVIRSSTSAGDYGPGGPYVLELRALRSIGVGEQLTVAYCSLLGPTPARRKVLRARYHFHCLCRRCTMDADATRSFSVAVAAAAPKHTAAPAPVEGGTAAKAAAMLSPLGEGSSWRLGDKSVSASDPVVIAAVAEEVKWLQRRQPDVQPTATGEGPSAAVPAVRELLMMCQEMAGYIDDTQTSSSCLSSSNDVRLCPVHYVRVAAAIRLAGAALQWVRQGGGTEMDGEEAAEEGAAAAHTTVTLTRVIAVLEALIVAQFGTCFDCAASDALRRWVADANVAVRPPLPPPSTSTLLLVPAYVVSSAVLPIVEAVAALSPLPQHWWRLASALCEWLQLAASPRQLRAQLSAAATTPLDTLTG